MFGKEDALSLLPKSEYGKEGNSKNEKASGNKINNNKLELDEVNEFSMEKHVLKMSFSDSSKAIINEVSKKSVYHTYFTWVMTNLSRRLKYAFKQKLI